MEISNNSVKPPPFNNEPKQKLASLASKTVWRQDHRIKIVSKIFWKSICFFCNKPMVMKILSHKHVKEHDFLNSIELKLLDGITRPLGFLSPFDPHIVKQE